MNDRATMLEAGPRFELGQIVATPGAIVAIEFNGFTPLDFLHRHVTGEWGVLTDEDKAANDAAVVHGGRILSAYELAGGERLWVLTEADRSVTTLLLPEEY